MNFICDFSFGTNYAKMMLGGKMEKIKVRLNTDLTQYGEGLKKGIEGYTIGNYGVWSRANDNFVGVCFPGVQTLDVLWKSLDIIDEDFLKRREEEKKKFLEELKTATEVEKHVGPYGGFRYLSYRCGKSHVSNHFKAEALEIEKILRSYGIEIKEVVDK